ncbi:MAG TPA: zinc-binding dehydrogenase, partial [Cryptosporangiaceae bacterium]|nr:zinc-binding dehydrogenase [Cryptosporangiaceae bacterium]
LRSRSAADKAFIVQDVRDHVWPLFEVGRVRPIVDRAVAMADAADAHRAMEKGEHIGKILLIR